MREEERARVWRVVGFVGKCWDPVSRSGSEAQVGVLHADQSRRDDNDGVLVWANMLEPGGR